MLVLALASLLSAAPLSQTPAPAAATNTTATPANVDPTTLGYYRMPAIHGETIVFVAEGDLWRVDAGGGSATRLTSHPGEERDPSISPDGVTLAYTATYEGPREVYTMPLAGGLPTRRTWDAARVGTTGWTPAGELVYATGAASGLPAIRTWIHPLSDGARRLVPLAQCSESAFLPDTSIVFTRLQFQGSHTDRYKGGTAQQLWAFTPPTDAGAAREATPLTTDYPGTSRRPLAWGDRVVFTSDRSGRLNLWSMKPDGSDLRQHTKHAEFDIGSSAIFGSRVVYQFGPDLRIHDLADGGDRSVDIRLASDFDHLRERWVEAPAAAVTSAHLSPDGDRVVCTIRGRVFVLPVKDGRTVDADRRPGLRAREARFMPDGASLVAISDATGELEVTTIPANGVGEARTLTTDGETVRWLAVPSPDGRRIAHTDKRLRLWVLDVASGKNTLVEENAVDQPTDLAWSHDSAWLAYSSPAANMNQIVRLWKSDGSMAPVAATTDRYDSFRPQWSHDGKFLYFLSNRTFDSAVGSPWGPRAPEPFLARPGRIYALLLDPGARLPFTPMDELETARRKEEKEGAQAAKAAEAAPPAAGNATPPAEAKGAGEKAGAAEDPAKNAPANDSPAPVRITLDGLSSRLEELPTPATNFGSGPLLVTRDALYWLDFDPSAPEDEDDGGAGRAGTLMALAIGHDDPKPKPIADGIGDVELSADGRKFLLRTRAKKGSHWHVADAKPAKIDLAASGGAGGGDGPTKLDFSGVSLSIDPRSEWNAMSVDAWRLLRDYFYDRGMHGVDWKATRAKYAPWVARVRAREELSDVFAEMTGELSALHHFVNGGDLRAGKDSIGVATLGADLVRDEALGGWRVASIPAGDPDEPAVRSPLSAPTASVRAGDTIRAIDGVATLSVADPHALLRNKAGRQVLLSVLPAGEATPRDRVVVPISADADASLRYRAWELERRRRVEELGQGDIGYIHLRAMGTGDFADFARDFYPVFARKALVIDVRHNRGGNIDSWILSRLLRKAWMYWNQHAGRAPSWNMQYAFRGHIVVLCNERTASDGEAFAEGFRRLGLGTVIGTRTWGGEIWLSSSNTVVDGGIASAGEYGVFDESGAWLIEGHGVDPDIVVDNLPHATFLGADAQLDAAIAHLKEKIAKDPRPIPPVPPAPVKTR